MRLTARDASLIRHATGVTVRVLLDGEDVTRDCVEVEAEAGRAAFLLRDASGRLVVDHRSEQPQRLWRDGVVRVLWRHGDVEWEHADEARTIADVWRVD